MSKVRIALANLSYPASPAAALDAATTAIVEAGAAGAQLVCFPECFLPGYRSSTRRVPPHDPAFLEASWARVAETAKRAHVGVVLGTERRVEGALRITALVVGPDGAVVGWQDKVQLDPSEDATFTPASERRVFRIGELTFGVVICHEGWRYPETVRWAVRHGAQLVFHPHFDEGEPGAFRPTRFGDPANTFHEKAMLCRAAENTCFFASVNCAVEGSLTTSAVARPDGTVLAWQPYGKAGLLVVDLELDEATRLLATRLRSA
jgi:predicted amidohydrolase